MVGRVEARAKALTPSFSYAIQLEDGYNLNQIREGGVYTVSSPGGAPAVGDFFLEVSHGPVAGNASAIQSLTDVSDGTEWVRVYVKTSGWSSWTQRGSGSGVATDLAIANQDADSIDIQSSTGDDVTIPSATTSLAGLMSAADKTILDSLGTPSTSFADNVFELKDNADATKKAVFELSGIATATTRTISIPNATGTIVLTGNAGTLQNKTLDNTNTVRLKTSLFTLEDPTTAAKKVVFDVSNVTATRTITYPSDNNITLVGTSTTQTLTNKTLGNTNTFVLSDSITTFQDNSDTSKQMKFELSGITTATTRTLTIPNTTATLAVAGDFSQSIGVASGSVSAPGLYGTGDTNTGIYFPAADQVAIAGGGAERMRVDSTGFVGIGITAPNNMLDVGGTIQCDGLRIDATPTISSDTVTHKLAVNLNGTTYYLLISNV